MKKLLLNSLTITAIALATMSCSKDRVETNELKSMKDSVSYAIGLNIGQSIKADGMELDMDIMIKALKQGFNNDTIGALNPTQLQEIMMKYKQEQMAKKQEEENKKLVDQEKVNRPKSEKFLAENKTKSGVITTSTGLQFEVIAQGKGAKLVNPNDEVKVNLKYSDLDGEVFQNTFESGPVPTNVEQLGMNFPFFADEIKNMSVGSHYRFWVSPDILSPNGPSDGKVIVFEVKIEELTKK